MSVQAAIDRPPRLRNRQLNIRLRPLTIPHLTSSLTLPCLALPWIALTCPALPYRTDPFNFSLGFRTALPWLDNDNSLTHSVTHLGASNRIRLVSYLGSPRNPYPFNLDRLLSSTPPPHPANISCLPRCISRYLSGPFFLVEIFFLLLLICRF